MSMFTFAQVAAMVRQIVSLHEAGLTYREIDEVLTLPRRAYLIINGRRAKFVLAVS